MCGHFWCMSCLATYVRAAVLSEASFPAPCCSQAGIDYEDLRKHLPRGLLQNFKAARYEYSISVINRTYCHAQTCRPFIDPTALATTM